MKSLLPITALIELGAGFALLAIPATAIRLLVGESIEASGALTVARIGGAGLLSLGLACWFARNDARSGAAKGLVAAMLFYNSVVVGILSFAALGLGLHGLLLWPGVVLHTLMAVGCMACLARSAERTAGSPQTETSKSPTKTPTKTSTRNKE
jgi:hypothetical protein